MQVNHRPMTVNFRDPGSLASVTQEIRRSWPWGPRWSNSAFRAVAKKLHSDI